MALKSCVYRNCENYVNVIDKTYSKENLTFFQFPKNLERRQKWMELGRAPPSLPANYYYYCSDHFDKRFLCIGPRRTILVGEAVPYEYENDQEDNTEGQQFISTEEELYLYNVKDDSVESVDERRLDQDLQVESTTMQDGGDIIQYLSNDINIDEYEPGFHTKKINDTKKDMCNFKRRHEDVTSPTSSSNSKLKILRCTSLSESRSLTKPPQLLKAISVRTNSVTSAAVNSVKTNRCLEQVAMEPKPINDCANTNISPESLIDGNHVTTFIFKGEEYVQMPKEHYIKEKMEMIQKLQKTEKVIAAIKEQLNRL